MIYLAGQIFVCLVLVLAIGFLMGWLLRSVGIVRQFGEVEATWKMRLRQKDEMLAKMFAENEEKEQQFTAMIEGAGGDAGENLTLKSKLQDANRALADLEHRLSARERDLRQATEKKTTSETPTDSGELRSQLALLRGAVNKKDGEIASLKKRLSSTEKELKAKPSKTPPPPEKTVAAASTTSEPSPEKTEEIQGVDELRNIFGIGPVLEKRLNAEGITTFRQVAAFTAEDIERVAEAIGCFSDRITKDDWMEGARQEHLRKYGEQI
ncbi:MAG: hypothetical protein AAF438_10535 [Pseudomonadota bacterium]